MMSVLYRHCERMVSFYLQLNICGKAHYIFAIKGGDRVGVFDETHI
jgi:hypothetical protein